MSAPKRPAPARAPVADGRLAELVRREVEAGIEAGLAPFRRLLPALRNADDAARMQRELEHDWARARRDTP